MMDAMEVAAALRRAAENAWCGTNVIVSGRCECPDGSCDECIKRSRAWFLDAADAIDRSALPEGVKWPRYENGKPVRFGDLVGDRGGAWMEHPVDEVLFRDDGTAELLGDGNSICCERGGSVVRIVLADDGEPLEPGQTVWGVDSGKKYDVAWLEGDVAIVDTYEGLASKVFASKLTHRRPVLDADRVPIREGDTVWNEDTSAGPFTVREIERSDDPDEPEDIVWFGEHASNGFKVWRIADQLTHAKPEIDTWERIEEDKGLNPFDYCKKVGHKLWTFDNAEEVKASDIVRRAKKLAGVDND